LCLPGLLLGLLHARRRLFAWEEGELAFIELLGLATEAPLTQALVLFSKDLVLDFELLVLLAK